MSEAATSTPKLDTVLAIGYNAWGKGEDAFEAIQNWKKQVGFSIFHKPVTVHMRLVPASFEMDEIGNLFAAKIEKLPDVVITPNQASQIWGGINILHELCYPVDDEVAEVEARQMMEAEA